MPNRLFGQRVVNTIDVELVDITVDYSTPLVPSFTTGTVNTLPLPDYEV
jgi:hypothetical protein